MSFKRLIRPNNFMLGYKPFSNVIYDESITPLEMLNKLSYKLNEIVASDSNVKDNVDKLLGVWKEAFTAKAGYIEPIETVYSENCLNPTLDLSVTGSEIFSHGTEKNHYIVKVEDRYKAIHLHMTEKNPVNWKVMKKINGKWSEFFSVEHSDTLDADIYLATSGNSWEYKVQAQDDHYTFNKNFKLSWSYGVWTYKDITCDKSNLNDLLFSDCVYIANFDRDYTQVVNSVPNIEWVFRYGYIEYEYEDTVVGHDYILPINLDKLKVSHTKYSWDGWANEEQLGGAVDTAGFTNFDIARNYDTQYKYAKMNIFNAKLILYVNSQETGEYIICHESTPSSSVVVDRIFKDVFGTYKLNDDDEYSIIYGRTGAITDLPSAYVTTDSITFTFTGLIRPIRLVYISASNFYKLIFFVVDEDGSYTINFADYGIHNITVNNYSRISCELMYNDWLRLQCRLVYPLEITE